MGVIKHDFTLQDARDLGILSKPIPIILAHDFKYGSLGEIAKLKSRACLHGHKGNMQKGVHYWETFSATPKEDTSRAMQAMLVNKSWKRKAGDVEKAFCWAELPKDEWMVCSYPDGLQRTNEHGEELYCIVVKNLYGGPQSGRNWGRCRDYTLLSIFNDDDYRMELAHRIKMDKVKMLMSFSIKL